MSPDQKPARRGQSSVVLGADQVAARRIAQPSVVVDVIDGKEVRLNLAPIIIPTPIGLHLISIYDNGNPYPLAVEMLMMFGQIKVERGSFVVKPKAVVKVPGSRTVAGLVDRLRDTKINFGFGRDGGAREISSEEIGRRRRDEKLLTKVLTMLGQANIVEQIEPDRSIKYIHYDERFHRPSDRASRPPRNSNFFDGQLY